MAENDVTIGNLVKLTSGGIQISSFTQIRAAIIKKYQDTFGSDIDLSTGSADGIFVNDIALIINNILQTMNALYGNLDINTASGQYLDSLCALSNVYREQATQSTATVRVTNAGTQEEVLHEPILFIDKSGTEWTAQGVYIIPPGSSMDIQVKCSTFGAIQAPINWIDRMPELNSFIISQPAAAVVGRNMESDSDLRARRNQALGSTGVTVLEGLGNSLRGISGIKDVYIYNNNSDDATEELADGVIVPPHSVYVVTRNEENVSVSDSTIGNIIHGKLTPGIPTTNAEDADGGTAKSYLHQQKVYGISISESEQNIYWKQAEGIAPSVVIQCAIPYVVATQTVDFYDIANKVMAYLNELPIGTTIASEISNNNLLIQILNAGPQQIGSVRPFNVNSITCADGATNPLAYFNYTSKTITTTQGGIVTITLS